MSGKVAVVIVDGLNYQVVLKYLNALVKTGHCPSRKLFCVGILQ